LRAAGRHADFPAVAAAARDLSRLEVAGREFPESRSRDRGSEKLARSVIEGRRAPSLENRRGRPCEEKKGEKDGSSGNGPAFGGQDPSSEANRNALSDSENPPRRRPQARGMLPGGTLRGCKGAAQAARDTPVARAAR